MSTMEFKQEVERQFQQFKATVNNERDVDVYMNDHYDDVILGFHKAASIVDLYYSLVAFQRETGIDIQETIDFTNNVIKGQIDENNRSI